MNDSHFVAAQGDFTLPANAKMSGGIILDDSLVASIDNCLGAISIAPHSTPTEHLAHSTSEVMFVAQGEGQLLTNDGNVPLSPGTAVFIPAEAWHSLENTGDVPLISVFSFPSPHRPETWSKE